MSEQPSLDVSTIPVENAIPIGSVVIDHDHLNGKMTSIATCIYLVFLTYKNVPKHFTRDLWIKIWLGATEANNKVPKTHHLPGLAPTFPLASFHQYLILTPSVWRSIATQNIGCPFPSTDIGLTCWVPPEVFFFFQIHQFCKHAQRWKESEERDDVMRGSTSTSYTFVSPFSIFPCNYLI